MTHPAEIGPADRRQKRTGQQEPADRVPLGEQDGHVPRVLGRVEQGRQPEGAAVPQHLPRRLGLAEFQQRGGGTGAPLRHRDQGLVGNRRRELENAQPR